MTCPGIRRPSGRSFRDRAAATLAVATLAAALAVGATGARTASPTHYRAHLNGVCRGYSAKFKTLGNTASRAVSAGNTKVYYTTLGRFLSLQLAEDRILEKTAPPVAIRGPVERAQALLRKGDAVLRAARTPVAKHNQAATNRLLNKITSLSKGINKALDAAGLRDCGSKQS